MNAPGFRYRSFGNEPVRVRPAPVEPPQDMAARRGNDRFVPLAEAEPIPAPEDMLQPFERRDERYTPGTDATLGSTYAVSMPEPEPLPSPMPMAPMPTQPDYISAPLMSSPPMSAPVASDQAMAEPLPAALTLPAGISPSTPMSPAPVLPPAPPPMAAPAPAPVMPALMPIFSWPDSPAAGAAPAEPAPAVEPRPLFGAAPSAPLAAPLPAASAPMPAEPPAEPLAMRGAAPGGFRLLESIGHRSQEDATPRVATAGGTLGLLRQAIEGGAGAALPTSAPIDPVTLAGGAGHGAVQAGGLLPAATVTVPLSDVMRLIAAGATPPPSPFDAFRVALGAQPGR